MQSARGARHTRFHAGRPRSIFPRIVDESPVPHTTWGGKDQDDAIFKNIDTGFRCTLYRSPESKPRPVGQRIEIVSKSFPHSAITSESPLSALSLSFPADRLRCEASRWTSLSLGIGCTVHSRGATTASGSQHGRAWRQYGRRPIRKHEAWAQVALVLGALRVVSEHALLKVPLACM